MEKIIFLITLHQAAQISSSFNRQVLELFYFINYFLFLI